MEVKIIDKLFSKKRIYRFNSHEIIVISDKEISNINNSYIVYKDGKNSSYITKNNEKVSEDIELENYMERVERSDKQFVIEDNFTLKDIMKRLDEISFFNIKTIYGEVQYRYDYDVSLISIFLNDELLVKSSFHKVSFNDNFQDKEFLIALLEATNFIYKYINYINAPDDD